MCAVFCCLNDFLFTSFQRILLVFEYLCLEYVRCFVLSLRSFLFFYYRLVLVVVVLVSVLVVVLAVSVTVFVSALSVAGLSVVVAVSVLVVVLLVAIGLFVFALLFGSLEFFVEIVGEILSNGILLTYSVSLGCCFLLAFRDLSGFLCFFLCGLCVFELLICHIVARVCLSDCVEDISEHEYDDRIDQERKCVLCNICDILHWLSAHSILSVILVYLSYSAACQIACVEQQNSCEYIAYCSNA